MRIFITGGAGFIGSNLIRLLRQEEPDAVLINVDKLTYAANPLTVEELSHLPNYRFVQADIADRSALEPLFAEGIDLVFHLAAESHVDRSILDAMPFVDTNLKGTQTLLDLARQYKVQRFIAVSTDEVYGHLPDGGFFTEETPLSPRSPYAASKAGSDHLVMAAWHTHRFPVIITRCGNNYGPYQFPEKLIPFFTVRALAGEPLPLYGDGMQVRDWIHVEDHCRALLHLARVGQEGAAYNISSQEERTNRQVAETILDILGKPKDLLRSVTDRPGHDRRYASDASKMRSTGWAPLHRFDGGLPLTVQWYLDHRNWWQPLIGRQKQFSWAEEEKK